MIRKWFSGVFRPDRLETDSVHTESIQGVSTLHRVGFTEGDIIPVIALNPASANSASTTSTDYTTEYSMGTHYLQWDAMFPDSATAYAGLLADLSPGTDETMDVRFWNSDNDEVVAEDLNLSSGQTWSGWQEYTPTTVNSPIQVRFEHRTDPGVNSSTSRHPVLILGMES